jgi:hypothetical protein
MGSITMSNLVHKPLAPLDMGQMFEFLTNIGLVPALP